MASGLGLQQPDTNTKECWSYDIASRARNIDKLNPAGRIWSIQRCTGSKNLLEAIRDPFYRVEVHEDFKSFIRMDPWLFLEMLERLGFQLRRVSGPYVEECLLITNWFYVFYSFTRLIYIDKLL